MLRTTLDRADEVEELVEMVKSAVIPFIKDADDAAALHDTTERQSGANGRTVLINALKPNTLLDRMNFSLPMDQGRGKEGLSKLMTDVLQYSVNTWDQGFLDKLYAGTNAVGVASELLLSVLNTNAHVYQVSPALTIIEKTTSRKLANLFGLTGRWAGGITCQGGSASNLTSLVVARGALHPETKSSGNQTHQFAIFTSEHSHYSIKKAAMTCGLGTNSVITVPALQSGSMDPTALQTLVSQALESGKVPLYVNATAGTTVYGSFDPLPEIASICRSHKMWFHVDASWGGAMVFSPTLRSKLSGCELADSITFNPHKMLNVPLTCSFLLARDVREFRKANSLPAGYLFHGSDGDGDDNDDDGGEESWDLADLTLQCGRRGDSLKLALAWTYYGAEGFGEAVDRASALAGEMAGRIREHRDFHLVTECPPPCLQVCFYYAPEGRVAEEKEVNTRRTKTMVAKLVRRGFMVDHAPGPKGNFFRVVINIQTLESTVTGLITALEEVGEEVVGAEGNA